MTDRRYSDDEVALILRKAADLQAQGAALAGEGVAFVDPTGIFRDVAVTTYADACCHLSDEGRRILAESIANAVAHRVSSDAAGDR